MDGSMNNISGQLAAQPSGEWQQTKVVAKVRKAGSSSSTPHLTAANQPGGSAAASPTVRHQPYAMGNAASPVARNSRNGSYMGGFPNMPQQQQGNANGQGVSNMSFSSLNLSQSGHGGVPRTPTAPPPPPQQAMPHPQQQQQQLQGQSSGSAADSMANSFNQNPFPQQARNNANTSPMPPPAPPSGGQQHQQGAPQQQQQGNGQGPRSHATQRIMEGYGFVPRPNRGAPMYNQQQVQSMMGNGNNNNNGLGRPPVPNNGNYNTPPPNHGGQGYPAVQHNSNHNHNNNNANNNNGFSGGHDNGNSNGMPPKPNAMGGNAAGRFSYGPDGFSQQNGGNWQQQQQQQQQPMPSFNNQPNRGGHYQNNNNNGGGGYGNNGHYEAQNQQQQQYNQQSYNYNNGTPNAQHMSAGGPAHPQPNTPTNSLPPAYGNHPNGGAPSNYGGSMNNSVSHNNGGPSPATNASRGTPNPQQQGHVMNNSYSSNNQSYSNHPNANPNNGGLNSSGSNQYGNGYQQQHGAGNGWNQQGGHYNGNGYNQQGDYGNNGQQQQQFGQQQNGNGFQQQQQQLQQQGNGNQQNNNWSNSYGNQQYNNFANSYNRRTPPPAGGQFGPGAATAYPYGNNNGNWSNGNANNGPNQNYNGNANSHHDPMAPPPRGNYNNFGRNTNNQQPPYGNGPYQPQPQPQQQHRGNSGGNWNAARGRNTNAGGDASDAYNGGRVRSDSQSSIGSLGSVAAALNGMDLHHAPSDAGTRSVGAHTPNSMSGTFVLGSGSQPLPFDSPQDQHNPLKDKWDRRRKQHRTQLGKAVNFPKTVTTVKTVEEIAGMVSTIRSDVRDAIKKLDEARLRGIAEAAAKRAAGGSSKGSSARATPVDHRKNPFLKASDRKGGPNTGRYEEGELDFGDGDGEEAGGDVRLDTLSSDGEADEHTVSGMTTPDSMAALKATPTTGPTAADAAAVATAARAEAPSPSPSARRRSKNKPTPPPGFASFRDCLRLRQRTFVAIHLIGVDSSKLSNLYLILVATAHTTYLVDMSSMETADEFKQCGLAELFEDELVTKLTFDCRPDVEVLQRQFGVAMRGVCDLQVMATLSISPRGQFMIGRKAMFQRLFLLSPQDDEAKERITTTGCTTQPIPSVGHFPAPAVECCIIDLKYLFVAFFMLDFYEDGGRSIGEQRVANTLAGQYNKSTMRDF